MNYPVWDLAMGSGVLMAVVSVLHVFVAHFAVGGGLWLVLTERKANASGDPDLRAHVITQSRFFLLITLVFGAITGVGIWFTAALISPHGIIALIRSYVWGWAIEWVFFVVELSAAIIYWYGWNKLDRRTHEIVGWIYFVSAFMSLVVINGIITFMLTPGGWLENREFWTGFFNPTYWPSLAIRSFASFAQAGLFTLLAASLLKPSLARTWVTRWSAGWVVLGMVLTAAASLWYEGALVAAMNASAETLGTMSWSDLVSGALPILPMVLWLMKLGMVATAAVALWPLIAPKTWNPAGAFVLFAMGLVFFFGGEWAREAGRKPYTIHGYLYSTGVLVEDEEQIAEDGVLLHTRWLNPASTTPVARGKDLYRAWCQPCHTMDGYNGLRPFVAHWTEEEVAAFLPRLQHMRAQMPAWHGGDQAVADLSAYLVSEGSLGDAGWPDDPVLAGQQAWDLHCGLCHTVDGFREIGSSLEGLSREELEETLDMLEEFTDEMPPYLADDVERGHLLDHLETIADGEEGSAS